jgi:hypothetical protein
MLPSIIVVRCFISNPYDAGSRSGQGPLLSVSLLKYLNDFLDSRTVVLVGFATVVLTLAGLLLLIVTLSAFSIGTFTVLHALSIAVIVENKIVRTYI